MRRRLFNLAAAVSLALCVATVALWVQTTSVTHVVGLDTRKDIAPLRMNGRYAIGSGGGRLTLAHRYLVFTPPRVGGHDVEREFFHESYIAPAQDIPRYARTWLLLGIGIVRLDWGGPGDTANSAIALLLPHWLVVLLFAIAPLRWSMLWRRRTIAQRHTCSGLCHSCGYDLRASPDRCPECGTAVN